MFLSLFLCLFPHSIVSIIRAFRCLCSPLICSLGSPHWEESTISISRKMTPLSSIASLRPVSYFDGWPTRDRDKGVRTRLTFCFLMVFSHCYPLPSVFFYTLTHCSSFCTLSFHLSLALLLLSAFQWVQISCESSASQVANWLRVHLFSERTILVTPSI